MSVASSRVSARSVPSARSRGSQAQRSHRSSSSVAAGAQIANSARSHPSASARSRSACSSSGNVPIIRVPPGRGHHVPPSPTDALRQGVRPEPHVVSTMSTRSERSFFPSNGEIGLHHHHEDMLDEAQLHPSAGMPSAMVTYHESGHLYPRFDRQKIRACLDENLVQGEKMPEPGFYDLIPTMKDPMPVLNAVPHASTPAFIKSSARSNSSRALSHISKASTASSIGSTGSWLRQREARDLRYKTNNSAYGSYPAKCDTGNERSFAPGFGNYREVWEHGQYRGRNSTDFQSCLVDNHRYVPFLQ